MTAPFAFQVVEQFTPDNVDSVRVNIKDHANGDTFYLVDVCGYQP